MVQTRSQSATSAATTIATEAMIRKTYNLRPRLPTIRVVLPQCGYNLRPRIQVLRK